ncbi:tonB-system energizer ExbB [Paracoccus sulfuroxidans]|uniref:Biopolymer transport protein ExbB n=1 Tax=Paracoccus sulfuroxidans TaxID=384678 RepID=A0A562NQL0_9RHOB|nr:tonB-system energizer ExbB [Paracoccus sulfuroxidans]TWI34321.1 biopolymer transport protein ExbB [Paracoccus sulfuroxidans]
MTFLPAQRPTLGLALTFACLMLTQPLQAQETTPGTQPPASETSTPTAPEAATTTPAAPAATTPTATTPAETAPAATSSTEATAPAEAPAATTATDAPAADPAGTSTSTAPAAASQPAPTADAPAASTTAVPATPAADTPATATPNATPAEPAATPVVAEDSARDPSLPHDLSPMGMFMAADWVVKGVMIGLAFASVVTWTVFVAKLLELWGASRRVGTGLRRIQHSASLPAALASSGKRRDPVSRMIRAASTEYDRSAPALDAAGDDGVKERISSELERIQAQAGRRMGRGTGVLATIGSTAPFVGLFGTVWGIMNSFIGISESQTTNLAIVAPGIAEALLATAIGLVAAIPAVVIYNVFARAVTGYRMRLADAAAGVGRLTSRDLDFRTLRPQAGE